MSSSPIPAAPGPAAPAPVADSLPPAPVANESLPPAPALSIAPPGGRHPNRRECRARKCDLAIRDGAGNFGRERAKRAREVPFNAGGKFFGFEKLLGKLNKANYAGCCAKFSDITNNGVPALVAKRKREMDMFINSVYDNIEEKNAGF